MSDSESVTPQTGCSCIDGEPTPSGRYNRPGQPALNYCLGTHADFLRRMLASLSQDVLADGTRPLRVLGTRDPDDPSIALLDAWATVADVLTFYQERIANECFLGTATERLSVLQLARLIGYELRPGVAAGTLLVFRLEDVPSLPRRITLDKGIKVQSLPGKDELPQSYETVEAIAADVEWNALQPALTESRLPSFGTRKVYLQGTALNLKIGDRLLFVGEEREHDNTDEHWDLRFITSLETDHAADRTTVTLDQGLGSRIPMMTPAQYPHVYVLRLKAALFGRAAADWRMLPGSTRRAYLDVDETDDKFEIPPDWLDLTLTAISRASPGSSSGVGLRGDYFNDTDPNPDIHLTNRVLSRVDRAIDFDWGHGSPDPRVNSDRFSVRWTGKIQAPRTGTYTFYTQSDDGVRLWVKGESLVDNWTNQEKTENSGKIELVKGHLYDIRLEYFEGIGVSCIRLLWSVPGLATKTIVTQDYVYPGDTPPVYLDAVYPQVIPGSWLVLSRPSYAELYRVQAVSEDPRIAFLLTAQTTRVVLTGENLLERFNDAIRETVVYAQNEPLELAEVPLIRPIPDDSGQDLNRVPGMLIPVQGKSVRLDHAVPTLDKGRRLVIQGKRPSAEVANSPTTVKKKLVPAVYSLPTLLLKMAGPPEVSTGGTTWHLLDLDGNEVAFLTGLTSELVYLAPASEEEAILSEVAVVDSMSVNPPAIVFQDPLKEVYDRVTVTILANVAEATHGETTSEVLGSGDASRPFLRFALRQLPLTYVSAATPSGTEATLSIWVNDVQWREVPSLYGHGPTERIYVVRTEDDGHTWVQFGDGTTGARPPTGQENIRAVYRKGIGLSGLVRSGQLSLLMTRPLGLKDTTNPLASDGAADPEKLEEARDNAPVTVLTLDRAVSLQDFEDFARSFAGIAKAQAVIIGSGERQRILVTVAGPNGALVSEDSAAYKNLNSAFGAFADPVTSVLVKSYRHFTFGLSAGIGVDPDYIPERVLAAVRSELLKRFSFDARSFGQLVAASEVTAAMQAVAGVVFTDLDGLGLGTTAPGAIQTPLQPPAEDAEETAAWLLTIEPAAVALYTVNDER